MPALPGLARRVADRFDHFVITWPKDRDHRSAVANHTFRIDHDYRSLRAAKKRPDVVKPGHLTAFVREQSLWQTVMLGKLFVGFNAGNRYRDDFGAGCLVIGPAISHAAHLFGADRRFVSRIKHKRDNFAAMIRQAPRPAFAVFQFEIRGRATDIGAGLGL